MKKKIKTKKVAKKLTVKPASTKERHHAVVQQKTFQVVSRDKKHVIAVQSSLIDDVVFYDDAAFSNLSKPAAADAEKLFLKAVAKFLGFDSIILRASMS